MIGIGVGINFIRFSKSGPVFDTDYQAVLNYATTNGYTLPSSAQQIKQNQLMLDLKSGGVWGRLDTFAVFATDGSSSFATIDWKRLTTYTNNNCTFTTNQGFTGNGSNGWIDTNYNASTQAVNYLLDDASRYIYHWSGSSTFDGNTFSVVYNSMRGGASVSQTINSSNNLTTSFTYTTTKGMKSIHRTSSSDVTTYNEKTGTANTQLSTVLNNINQFILRRGGVYSTNTVSAYAMGASMISQNSAFVDAMDAYINSL